MSKGTILSEDIRSLLKERSDLHEELNQAIHLIFKVSYGLKLPVTLFIPYLSQELINRHKMIL